MNAFSWSLKGNFRRAKNLVNKFNFYKFAILFLSVAIIFNEPECATNALSMFMFLFSILCGFVGVIKTAESDFKEYGV